MKERNAKKWYVYLLRCSDGTYYCGITTDVERRLCEHNETKRAARYTRARRPVSLVGFIEAKTRSEAQKKEISIKRMSRQEKEGLFSIENSY